MPDCLHPEPVVVVDTREALTEEHTKVEWCPVCGSVRANNGDHGAPAGEWRSPSGLVLPGWTCKSCRAFNGEAMELKIKCRSCGVSRSVENRKGEP